MMCEERAGFLFARACDQTSAWSCNLCGKPICILHSRPTSQGNACIACARTAAQTDATRTDNRDRRAGDSSGADTTTTTTTSGAYSDTDDPYFYRSSTTSSGSREYFDADDRRAFDHSANHGSSSNWENDPSAS